MNEIEVFGEHVLKIISDEYSAYVKLGRKQELGYYRISV